MTKKNTTKSAKNAKNATKKTAPAKKHIALAKAVVTVPGADPVEIEMKNPCQMWKKIDGIFAEHGNQATVTVLQEDGTVYMEFTMEQQKKTGKWIKRQSVKENRRAQQMKVAAQAKKEAEKREAKNAKERARRAAKKAAAAKAQEGGETVENPVTDEATAPIANEG